MNNGANCVTGLGYTLCDYAAWYHACEAVGNYLREKWVITA